MSRSNFALQEHVSIDDILLDERNPRIRAGSNQNNCIEKVLRKEDQMLKLMESIATEGLSTAQILVTSSPLNGKWIVKDGNRRVTALKLLNNPDLCTNSTLREKINKIIGMPHANIPSKIDCLSSNNVEAMARELVLRHSGELGGVGQIGWSSYLRTIYLLNNAQASEYKRAGQYLLWAEKNNIEVDDEFPITSVARFFSAENIKILGFDIQNDELVLIASKQVAIAMARRVIDDFGTGKVKVNNVYTTEQAIAYLTKVRLDADWPLATTNITSPNTVSDSTSPSAPSASSSHGTASQSVINNPTTPQVTLPQQPRPGRPPNKPAWDRKQLFTKASPSPSISSSELKARGILYEIGQIKDIRDCPLTLAFLLRAIIELSEQHYRNSNQLTDKAKLADNIAAACDSMTSKHTLNSSQIALVKAYTVTNRNDVGIFNVDTLQKYLHRSTHLPSSETIITFWDELCPFIRACWG